MSADAWFAGISAPLSGDYVPNRPFDLLGFAVVEHGGIPDTMPLAELYNLQFLAVRTDIAFEYDLSYQQHYLSFLEDY